MGFSPSLPASTVWSLAPETTTCSAHRLTAILSWALMANLNSTFNLTALIGGDGQDTLTTNVSVPLQADAPVHGVAIQLGETGNDNLNATVTLQDAGTHRVRDRRMCSSMAAVATMSSTPQRMWLTSFLLHSECDRQHLRNRRRRQRYHQCASRWPWCVLVDSISMNTVDAGSGDDHVTADAETDFSAHHTGMPATCSSVAAATMFWMRPLSVDRMPQKPFQMSFTVAKATTYCMLST